MVRTLKVLVVVVALVGPALGQRQGGGRGGGREMAPPPLAAPVTTLKANARIVVVDVVVTDRNQHPVHGLKAGDFQVFDNSAAQTVTHFEEHNSLKPVAHASAGPKPPAGVFINYGDAPSNGAVNVLLLDRLNTPMIDQTFLRLEVLKYLDHVKPGTQIAIFGLTTRLTVLQGFTSDPERLKAVIGKTKEQMSPQLGDAVGGGGVQDSVADQMEDNGADAETVANMEQFEAEQQSADLRSRAKYTLDAMSQIGRYLANLPGRKNLIWFSGSFPLNILPDGDVRNQFEEFTEIESWEEEFRATVDQLTRSQVAVYPIDARGLFTNTVNDVATTRNYGNARGAARLNQDLNKFYSNTAAEAITMRAMAGDTGGRAFMNTNGLSDAVESAIEDGANYYTLTYAPSEGKEGEFRKIKVKAKGSGLSLAYRQGYYVRDAERAAQVDEAKVGSGAADAGAADAGARNAIRVVMMRGAPVAREVPLAVGVTQYPVGPEEKSAEGNVLAPKTLGPYRRYAVNYSVEPSDVGLKAGADGKYHGALDLVIFAFDTEGGLVNSNESHVDLMPTAEQMKKAEGRGFVFHQEISVPEKGEYFLRIAVHDKTRDKFGAVEMATSEVEDGESEKQKQIPCGNGKQEEQRQSKNEPHIRIVGYGVCC